MTEKKKTKRELESEQKKMRIIESAEKLFSKFGYDQTTLQDISEDSGFSIGSIYNFFRTKENILMEISQDMASFSFDLADAEKKAEDPIPAIMDYLLAYSRNWEKLGVDLTNSVYRVFLKSYIDSDSHRFQGMTYQDSLITFIQMAQDLGTFSSVMTAEESARYIVTFCRGLLHEWCLFGGSYSLSENAEKILPFMLQPFRV